MKNIANQNMVNKESALSMQAKINSFVSDLVKVMRNVSVQCNGEERSKHIQNVIHRMQFSGYLQEGKILVYKKAKRVFDNIVERHRAGQCPPYRNKFWQRRERTRGALTSGIIGTEEGIIKQFCLWRKRPMES